MIGRRRAIASLAFGALLVAAIVTPAAASAATVSAGGPLDVQIWPQGGQTVVITSVELPQGTKLPALVRIPVIPGAKVEWTGEILGADAANDIAREYRLVDGVGGKYAEFYLTKSLHGQVDSVASTLTVSGTTFSTTVDWVQSVNSSETQLSVRLPAGLSAVKITPSPEGKPNENASGEVLYALPSQTLPIGGTQAVSLSYSTLPPAEPATGPSANTIIFALLGVLGVAIVALVFVARRRSS